MPTQTQLECLINDKTANALMNIRDFGAVRLADGSDIRVTRQSGELEDLAYFHIRDGKHDRTHEVIEGRVFVDVDANGTMLGIEVLSGIVN